MKCKDCLITKPMCMFYKQGERYHKKECKVCYIKKINEKVSQRGGYYKRVKPRKSRAGIKPSKVYTRKSRAKVWTDENKKPNAFNKLSMVNQTKILSELKKNTPLSEIDEMIFNKKGILRNWRYRGILPEI